MTSKKNNDHVEPEDNKTQETSPTPKVENHEATKPEKNKDTSTTITPESTPKAPADTSHSSQQEAIQKQAKRGVKLGAIAIALSVIFGSGLMFQMQQQNAQYEAQIAALQAQLKQAQSSMTSDLSTIKQDTISKATEVTHRAETILTQQQKSIESLQLAVADVKGRRPNDWLLAEADYLVKLAGRKLFLEQDVVSATKLMESADQRIASLNDPSLVPLRKAMANDITKLKTVPLIDRDGLVLRLTALQQQVDALPLANAILPEAQVEEKQVVSQDIYDWKDNLMTSLKDFSENFITFRTRDGNVIPLLSPQQHFYLKENVKGKLETAIKAVYDEQGEIYTASLSTAQQWSTAFFNNDDNAVIEFNKALGQLSGQNIQVEYPVKLQTQNVLADVINERLRREVTTMITEEK
ncbi:uroporphyrinogen-III C-methyltransferase [Vibrio sp. SCSIO 43135]|uniref:uroporphyrinogen-III C-methyltransferase n=1 Tax=Vibrio sp. SCSIO 43135 TaxID=2819096 RepID=UPI002075FDB4|nr:uroporphyrinogen-III C-methyltransferase [Vibrio sp. SCSIO 43135]USD41035.1 uroporphyrinogen-III C-methyltransferase [Vibrio sp. SCSIO 43135]